MMLAVMPDTLTATRRRLGRPAHPGRGDYGIDPPRALTSIALPGVAALGAVAAGVALGWTPGLIIGLGAVMLTDLAVVCAYLYATRIGKLRVWAEVLDSFMWRGDESGLDLGCGRGAVLIALARRLPRGRVTGIDIWDRVDQSGNAEAVTQRNAAAEGVADRVDVETGDIRELTFPAASFDVVTSSLVLHNLPSPADRERVLQNAMRVLKPGGRLLVADIRNIDEYRRVLEKCRAENLSVWDFGLRACFGIPRLRLISGLKQCAESSPESGNGQLRISGTPEKGPPSAAPSSQ